MISTSPSEAANVLQRGELIQKLNGPEYVSLSLYSVTVSFVKASLLKWLFVLIR